MIIDFDETDFDELSRVITKLNKQRNNLLRDNESLRISNARYKNRMQSIEREYDAVQLIYASDISTLYQTNNEDRTYYVYVHCNPLQRLNAKQDAKHLFCASTLQLGCVPFYVGKGQGDRCYDLNRNEGHRKIKQHINKAGSEVVVVKLAEGLMESEALALEAKLIDILGLKQLHSTNTLINLDEGYQSQNRRALYMGKDVKWYLNRTKMQIYNSVPKG